MEVQSPDSCSSAIPFLVQGEAGEGSEAAGILSGRASPTPAPPITPDSPLSQKLAADSTRPLFPPYEQGTETTKWLKANYEFCDGFSLPKGLIYDHYTAFCRERGYTPVNTACFGKAVRGAFFALKTRRIGSRSQSRYHYYGIRVRGPSGSPKNNPVDSLRPSSSRLGEFPVAPEEVLPSGVQAPAQSQTNLSSALIWASTSLLPEFPDASNLKHTLGVAAFQVNYLISSYRSHCIQVLETVLRGGLADVGFQIKHFWQHLNDSFKDMLNHIYLADTIAVCDTHLYHTITHVLIPGTVQPLPAHLLRSIRNFACHHAGQVEKALMGLPSHLIDAKLKVARRFALMLSRKTTLAHLGQASRGILCSESGAWHMKDDWAKRTEQGPDCTQTAWTAYDQWGLDGAFLLEKLESYGELLQAERTVEDHIHWLEMLVRGITGHIRHASDKSEALRSLLLQWSYLSHLIIRDQTLRSAVSFGSFHLLNLLYQEYLMYVTDIHNAQQAEELLWKKVFGQSSKVSPYFLTSSVVCDLEECNLPDRLGTNPPDQGPSEPVPLLSPREAANTNQVISSADPKPSSPVVVSSISAAPQKHLTSMDDPQRVVLSIATPYSPDPLINARVRQTTPTGTTAATVPDSVSVGHGGDLTCQLDLQNSSISQPSVSSSITNRQTVECLPSTAPRPSVSPTDAGFTTDRLTGNQTCPTASGAVLSQITTPSIEPSVSGQFSSDAVLRQQDWNNNHLPTQETGVFQPTITKRESNLHTPILSPAASVEPHKDPTALFHGPEGVPCSGVFEPTPAKREPHQESSTSLPTEFPGAPMECTTVVSGGPVLLQVPQPGRVLVQEAKTTYQGSSAPLPVLPGAPMECASVVSGGPVSLRVPQFSRVLVQEAKTMNQGSSAPLPVSPGAPMECATGGSVQLQMPQPRKVPIQQARSAYQGSSAPLPTLFPAAPAKFATVLAGGSDPLQDPQLGQVPIKQAKTTYQVKCPQHVLSGSCQTMSKKAIKFLPGPSVGKAGDASRAMEPIVVGISDPLPGDEVKVTEGQVLLTGDGKSFVVNGVSGTKPDGDHVHAN